MPKKKATRSIVLPFLTSVDAAYPHEPVFDPQLPQALGPNSIEELIRKPYPRKSTLTGFAFS